MLDLILHNIEIVIIFLVVVYQLITAMSKKSDSDRKKHREHRRVPGRQQDRAREIQQEIRRKIQERQREDQAQEGSLVVEPPEFESDLWDSEEYVFESPTSIQRAEEASLAQQIQEIEALQQQTQRAVAQRSKHKNAIQSWGTGREQSSDMLLYLKQACKDPEAARKAFLLYEVFGTPIGLRQRCEGAGRWNR